MPVTPFRNMIYLATLPILGVYTRGHYQVEWAGDPFFYQNKMIRHLEKNRFLGGVVFGRSGERSSAALVSLSYPPHLTARDTLFRVASITKTAVAVVSLRLVEKGILPLHESIHTLLPTGEATERLKGITLHHLLSHRSGLRDTPAYQQALTKRQTFHHVLLQEGTVSDAQPGQEFRYSNFGYGLVGCLWESVMGKSMETIMQEELLLPLQMRGTLDGSTLSPEQVMPVERVHPYWSGREVRIPALGRHPLQGTDPLHRFGITAGSLYTDAVSLSKLLDVISPCPQASCPPLLSADSIRDMTSPHSHYGKISPTLSYGLGLTILKDPAISDEPIYGHQGYAYGCAHGMFIGANSGQQLISLNGGCSEARIGMMGRCSLALLRWAWQKEFPHWSEVNGTGT